MRTFILLIVVVLVFAACGNGNGGNEGNGANTTNTIAETPEMTETLPEISPSDLTAAILAEIEVPSAVEKDISSLNIYYDIDEEMIEDMSLVICGSGAYPDELAVFLLKDEVDVGEVIGHINTRHKNQTALFRDYTPDEMYKLDAAIIGFNGRYVYFLVCEDNSMAESIIKSLL